MAQYYEFTDPVTSLKVRIGARDVNSDGLPEYVEDKELTETGFSGDESLDGGLTGDWVNMNYSE